MVLHILKINGETELYKDVTCANFYVVRSKEEPDNLVMHFYQKKDDDTVGVDLDLTEIVSWVIA